MSIERERVGSRRRSRQRNRRPGTTTTFVAFWSD